MLYIETRILITHELVGIHHFKCILIIIKILIAGMSLQQRIRKCPEIFPRKHIIVQVPKRRDVDALGNGQSHFLVLLSAIQQVLDTCVGFNIHYRVFAAHIHTQVLAFNIFLFIGVP